MRITLVLLVLSVTMQVMQVAQAKIANHLPDVARLKHGAKLSAEASATWESGSTSVLSLSTDLLAAYATESDLVFVTAEAAYAKLPAADGGEFRRSTSEHIRYRHSFDSLPGRFLQLGVEAFTQHDMDAFALLRFRGLVGAGYRIGVELEGIVSLAAGSAIMLERIVDTEKATFWRWSDYLEAVSLFSEQVTLSGVVFAQPRFDTFSDLNLMADCSVRVKLTTWLSLRSGLHIDYSSMPPAGVPKINRQYGTAFVFDKVL